jgi:ParB/RepB/Spo0J family partition protein
MRETKEILICKLSAHPRSRVVVTSGGEWSEFEASVREHGILEPLSVRMQGDGYQALSGHRRLVAAERCGLASVPCHVVDLGDADALWLLANSNLHRQSLSLVEEAELVSDIVSDLGVAWDDVGRKLSREEIWVRARKLVFEFPAELRGALCAREECRRLSEGAFRQILIAPRDIWPDAVRAVLFPPGSDEPLSEQRAREEIQFALIPEWEEKKKWEAGAEDLRQAMNRDLRQLCENPFTASLSLVIGQWDDESGTGVIDAVDAMAPVPGRYFENGQPSGKAWVSYAEKIGLTVVVLRPSSVSGMPRAVVSRRSILDDAAAREEGGVESPLLSRPRKK